jgi:hypothetical protein
MDIKESLSKLGEGSVQERRAASYRLIKLKDPISVPHLIRAYSDNDPSVRRNIIEALQAIGTQEALNFLADISPEKLAEKAAEKAAQELDRKREEFRAVLRARPKFYTGVTWEYCQLADVPWPDKAEHKYALLNFPSDDSTIEVPTELVLDTLSELGKQGWEMVQAIVVRDARWPAYDLRSRYSYLVESTFDLAPRGAEHVYESLATGWVYFFKRPNYDLVGTADNE